MPKLSHKTIKFIALFFIIAVIAIPKITSLTQAAALTEASIQLDRMITSNTDTSVLVVVKPASTATEARVQVTFATGFTVDAIAGNITTTTAGLPSTYQGESLTTWPSIGATATSVSGQDVVIASGDLTPGTLYGFYINAGIDNPGSGGEYEHTITTQTSAPADIDSSNVSTRIVTNDQIVLTATVPTTLSCTLSANTDSFTADLDSASVISTNGRTLTIGTNAGSGWIAWVQSANAALSSTTTSNNISTTGTINNAPSTLSAGSDGYVLDVDLTTDSATATTGTVTIDAEYLGADTSSGGTLNGSALEEIATANGVTDGDILTLIGRASISAITPAAPDYTDTWTVICSGNY